MVASPFLSIILPIYNVEKYLDRCMKSILKQSFKDYEIILVDDGSTDSSPILCDKYGKQLIKLKCYIKVMEDYRVLEMPDWNWQKENIYFG